jgi:hypothetical protein
MQRFGAYPAIAIAGALFYSVPAEAQASANRTFVSGQGLDTNPCNYIAPCRSFAAAVLVTNSGGEITMLDPAGYGAVTITKAITIVNDGGGEAGINDPTAGTSAITINAGANDVVNLRGLTLNGVNAGDDGIRFIAGGTLNIQNCTIRGFTDAGIKFVPTASATLTVFDTIISNNSGTFGAIEFAPSELGSAVTVNAYLGRVQVIGNGADGIHVNAANLSAGDILNVTITDSVITGQRNGAGILIPSLSSDATVTLINTQLIDNKFGFNTLSPGTSYIAKTTISGNSTGYFVAGGGVLQSFGDNYITDTTNTGGLTPLAQQ